MREKDGHGGMEWTRNEEIEIQWHIKVTQRFEIKKKGKSLTKMRENEFKVEKNALYNDEPNGMCWKEKLSIKRI